MAKQASIFKMVGTLDDATFFNTSDGFLVRKNNPVSGNRIKTDPSFELTRQNMAEFGYAGTAGKLIRNAFNSVVRRAGDRKVTSRLVQKIRSILNADTENDRGERVLNASNISKLESFEFNNNAGFDNVFTGVSTVSIDRTAGTVSIQLDGFSPRADVTMPSGATHFKFVTAASAIDFINNKRKTAYAESDMLPVNNLLVTLDPMVTTLEANTTLPVFAVIGIEFFQLVKGNYHQHDSGSFNTAKILAVSLKP